MIPMPPHHTPKPTRCDACGSGPCHDGTLCNNAHHFREMVVVIDMMPARQEIEDRARFLKIVDEIERHPRHQNHAPRSPRPGFRKGRAR
jgi:hypothetical protein